MKSHRAWERSDEWDKVQRLTDELGIELPEVAPLDDEDLCAWEGEELDDWALDLGDAPSDLPL